MTRSTQARAPIGYENVVPLLKKHRVLLPGGATPEFCRKLNALVLSAAEFVAAGRDYPIVFASADDERSFAPVAVLGFAADSNLFVDASGEWDRGCYLPAYVRRYPFCVSGERVVCVVKSYIDRGGIALHDKAGKPSAQWQAIEALISSYEADLAGTARFCIALQRLGLLESFVAEVKDPAVKVAGMARVSEAKLRALPPMQLKALAEKGWLGLIYAHLHSLDGFLRLAARLKARKAAGKGSRPSRRSRPR
jgi:hypothetical protein